MLERLPTMIAGEFDLAEGTLYPALHRLESSGLLASERTEHNGRPRRVYSLTARGRTALEGERGEWARFAAGVTRTLEAAR